jgi:hypothetical protein
MSKTEMMKSSSSKINYNYRSTGTVPRVKKVTSTGNIVYVNQALSMPEPLWFIPLKKRTCLKCRKKFETRGNYICPKCTDENDTQNLSRRQVSGMVKVPKD